VSDKLPAIKPKRLIRVLEATGSSDRRHQRDELRELL